MVAVPVLLLFVAGVLSAPYRPDFEGAGIVSTGLDCNEGQSGLRRDSISTFTYEGETQNAIVGASGASTGLKIVARIHIQATDNCMYTMQVSESKLLMKSKNSPDFVLADESKKFSRELEAQELPFRVVDGSIKELFPSPLEKNHVLNLKRGILSTLQLGNPAADTEQVGVNGVCKVSYLNVDGVIVKLKSLSNCDQRVHSELGIQASTFQQDNLPINPLNSTSKCTYKLNDVNMIQSVECNEEHILRPFSAGYKSPSGAITSVKQTLTVVQVKKTGYKPSGNGQSQFSPVSLVFEHEHEEMKPDSSIVDRVDKIMNVLVDKSDKLNLAVKQNYAHEFTQLVTLFRQLDRKRMMPIWNKYFDCTRSRVCEPDDSDIKEVYRQYLLDALTYCGTSTCVYVVHNVIIDESVTGEKVTMFLQGIALVAKPTKAMVRDILEIADKKPSRQAFLTLGTLLNRYCKSSPDGCAYGKTNPITQAELFLEGKLGRECEGQDNFERVEEIIRAIKAIGNAGRPTHVWNILSKCARLSLHQNVSIAALDAMRHMPCEEERLKQLHEMHSNIEMDPERRIHVFLAIMKCPSKNNLAKIIDQLNVEPSRQMGSFMWTYLKNLNESSDPEQAEVRKSFRELLQGRELRSVDLEKLKYSRSWEGSLHSKLLKSGLKAEGHVVFHPESYLPRSGLLNFTAHVMGVPLNVLEMAIRVEGLETIIEDVFGPNGVLPDSGILKLFNVTITKEDIERVQKARNRRDVNQVEENIADIHARVNKRRIQPSGSLSVKMFGHDIRLFSYDDIYWMIDQIDNMNVIELLLKLAKGGHKTFTKSFMFLEMTQTVPTGLGLPLKLKLSGSAATSLELDGKVDVRNMFWGPSQMELKGFLRPSAVAEISGQMGIESHFIRSGMFVNSSVFTSTMLKGGILYKEGKILKFNLDPPENSIEIFNVSSTPYLYFNEDLELVRGAQRRISPEFCLNSTRVLGLGLCTSFAVPVAFREYESPYFPLSGPAHFGVKLVKSDPKLTTYETKVQFEKVEEARKGKEYVGTFEMGTPGATYSRRVSGMVKYVETANTKTLTMGSAEGHKRFEFMTQYRNDTNRFEVEARSNIFTPEMVAAKFLYFNDSIYTSKHIGALVSAHYGELKVQQMWKFVHSTTPKMYKLFSKTTYYPGKHITSELAFLPSTRMVIARFNANQFNQTIDFMGSIVNTETANGLNLTFTHESSRVNGTLFAGLVSDQESKRLVLNGTLLGKSAEAAMGYFKYDDGYELQVYGEVANKKIELFTNYSSYEAEENKEDISEVLLGARYNGKAAGGRVYFQKSADGNMKDICSTVFLGHDEPASACMSLENDASESGLYKRLSFTGRVLQRTASVDFEYESDTNVYGFNSTLLYNNKNIARTSWQMTYNGLLDAELKMIANIKNRSASVRVYSTSENEGTVFGIEGEGFNKTIGATVTYSINVTETTRYLLHLKLFFNGKLPFCWEVYLENGNNFRKIGSHIRVSNYILESSSSWIQPADQEYSVVWDVALSREGKVILGFKDTSLLIASHYAKSFKQLWTITVLEKSFEYGWNANYRNLGNGDEDVHQVKLGLQYARGKMLLLTTNIVNSKSKAGMIINFKFLPYREVTHTIMYLKNDRRFDVDLEFLPKMFVRFMAKLDVVEGWKLTTRVKFDWKRMNRALKWVTRYINTPNTKGLSFQFKAYGQEFKVISSYEEKSRTGTLALRAFSRTIKFIAHHDQMNSAFVTKVVTETPEEVKQWLEAITATTDKEISFEVLTSKRLFKVAALLDRADGFARISLDGSSKPMISFEADLKRKQDLFTVTLRTAGKERFMLTGKLNRAQKMAFLYFDFMKKNWNIGFSGRYDALERSVSLTAEALQTVVGLTIRADPREYIVGVNAFVQDRFFGWHVYVDPAKRAIIFNVTLTPELSFQTITELIDDRILKFTNQRKIGRNVVNETSFRYDLSMYESRLIFEWNVETIKSLKNVIIPIVKNGFKNLTIFSDKLANMAKEMTNKGKVNSIELYKKVGESLIRWVHNVNNSYNSVDFKGYKDNATLAIIDYGKQLLRFAKDAVAFMKVQKAQLHANIPLYMEQANELRKRASIILDLATKVGKNLTESAKPVVETAIKLAKEFKIRGKSMEELYEKVAEIVAENIEYVSEMVKQEASKRYPIFVQSVRKMHVPYLEQTVEELFKKVEEVARKATFNFDAVKTKEYIFSELQTAKIYGRTLKGHLDFARNEVEKLPEVIKRELLLYLEASKKYTKALQEVKGEVEIFLEPLVNLMRNVNASLHKHYGPPLMKILNRMEGKVSELYKPYQKIALAYLDVVNTYVEKVNAFVRPFAKPIRFVMKDVQAQIADLKVLEKRVGDLLDAKIKILAEKLTYFPDQLERLNKTAIKAIEKFRGMYSSFSMATNEEAIDMMYEIVGILAREVYQKMTKSFERQGCLYRKAAEVAKKFYEKAALQYKQIKEYDMEELAEEVLLKTEDIIFSATEELTDFVKDLSNLYIGTPFISAWTESNLADHLSNYGLNGKVAALALRMRNSNFTEIVTGTVERLRQIVLVFYSKAAGRALQYSSTLNGVVEYLKSVPKKDFNDFSDEVDKYLVLWAQKVAYDAKKRCSLAYDKMVKLSEVMGSVYENYYMGYVAPAAETFDMLRTRTVYVFEDNKDEARFVYDHYRKIFESAFEKKYSKARQILMKKYGALYSACEQMVTMYGEMTWEEAATKIYGKAMQVYEKMYTEATKKQEEARKQIKKWSTKLEKKVGMLKGNVEEIIAKCKSRIETVLVPEARRIFQRYSMVTKMYIAKLRKLADEYFRILLAKGNKIYNDNKKKTIEELYNEALAESVKAYQKYTLKVNKELELQYARASIVVKDILLPELKREAESIVNQTVRAAVVLGNKTVDCFHPHYNLVRMKINQAIDGAWKSAPIVYRFSKEKALEMYNKFEKDVMELKMKLENHPLFIESQNRLKDCKYLKALRAKYADMKPVVYERYNDLIAIVQELANNAKVLEMQDRFNQFVNSEDFKSLQQTLGNIKESMGYTAEQLKPKVEELFSDLQRSLSNVPVFLSSRATYFRQHPEDCLWTTYREVLNAAASAIAAVRADSFASRYSEAKSALLGLAFEVTDMRTKEAAIKVIERVLEKYEQMKQIPVMVKQKYDMMVSHLLQRIDDIKNRAVRRAVSTKDLALSKWAFVKSEWDRCPITTILEHEVWGEIVTEILSHELIAEGKNIAKLATAMLKSKGKEVVDYTLKMKTSVVAGLMDRKSRYEAVIMEQYGKGVEQYERVLEYYSKGKEMVRQFVKEKTIEEIVAVMEMAFIRAEEQLRLNKMAFKVAVDRWVSDLRVAARSNMEKVIVIASPYVSRTKEELGKRKICVETRFGMFVDILGKYKALTMDNLENAKTKALENGKRFWSENKITERFNDFKRMKIKDTVILVGKEIQLLPSKIGTVYAAYKLEATKKATDVNKRVADFVKPYTEMVTFVTGPLRWVGNEVNETAVFIYRYYGLREQSLKAKEYLVSKSTAFVKIAPGLVIENAKKTKLEVLRALYNLLVEVDQVDFVQAKAMIKSYADKLPKEIKFPSWSELTEQARTLANDAKDESEKMGRKVQEMVKRYADRVTDLPEIQVVRNHLDGYKKYLNYVIFKPSEGQLVIRIPHYMPIEPSFSYQLNKVSKAIKTATNKTLDGANRLYQDVMKRTEGLRTDIFNSYLAHKKLALKGFEIASNYRSEYGIDVVNSGYQFLNASLTKARSTFVDLREQGEDLRRAIMAIALDVYDSENMTDAYQKIKDYGNFLTRVSRHHMRKAGKKICKKSAKLFKRLQKQYEKVLVDMKPYASLVKMAIDDVLQASLVKMAIDDVLQGKRYADAFKNVGAQLRKTYRYTTMVGRNKVNEFFESHPEFLKLVDSYKAVHAGIIQKHLQRIQRVLKLAKVGVDRTVRVLKKSIKDRSQRPMIKPLKKTAMIFGKSHVMTFDRKFYEFSEYNKHSCTYLLARDFHHGNFTLLSQPNHIIISTPDIKVDINDNINSWVTVNGYTSHVKGLPVQSPTGKCVLDDAFVKCSFEQGLDVKCDMKHFDCVIELSGWHYGKTEGLLGTNNNEVFDDFKMPGGAIADTVNEFADAWEVSGDSECLKNLMDKGVSKCEQLPSPKCKEVFSRNSPLSKYFSFVDPAPFIKACEIDTAVCDHSIDLEFAHCNATASYVNLLRSDGFAAQYLAECAYFARKEKTEVKGARWNQTPRKGADVVVMVSERTSNIATRRTIANIIYSLNKNLVKKGYDTRYALIGFGGDHVHENPHFHTALDGAVFMNEFEVSSTLKEMPYTGSSRNANDGYAAIHLASTLSFRPEASRVFLLFNSDKLISTMYGPTLDETSYALRYEANASLFAFDKVNFKNLGKGKIIGQTARRMYMVPPFRALPVVSSEFPDSLFGSLAYETDGGLFTNKIKPRHMKAIASGLSDAVLFSLKSSSQTCKSCYLYWGNAGQGVPICRTNNRMTC